MWIWLQYIFHSNVVIKDYVEPPINTKKPNLFNAALCSLDLEHSNNWMIEKNSIKHVNSHEVFKSLD
jgi:hypothetical protein